MAIAFAYTVATNTVVVTGGTSGTPATFADFVTADRAGTGTSLRAATAGTATVTLTYPVRPVEFRALVVKCIVAAKTAEADFIFITGTDAWDAAQTESIDVTAGNGTYTTTKRWRTITNIDCSDNAAGGGTVWADGTVAVTQDIWGVIWDKGNGQYQTDCFFNIGNGSTATFFAVEKQDIFINAPTTPTTVAPLLITANAEFRLGKLVNGQPTLGSILHLKSVYIYEDSMTASSTAVFKIYGSVVDTTQTNKHLALNGVVNIQRSSWYGAAKNLNFLRSENTLIDFYSQASNITFYSSPTTISNFAKDGGENGLVIYSAGSTTTVINPIVTNITSSWNWYVNASGGAASNLKIRNGTPEPTTTNVQINTASHIVTSEYTCDINICDKNGTALQNVVVDCVDQLGNAIWTAGTVVTDASGNITQQIIPRRIWTATAACYGTCPLVEKSPHKFTISKAGYQTLVLDNITVSAAIKWHLELQQTMHNNFSHMARINA